MNLEASLLELIEEKKQQEIKVKQEIHILYTIYLALPKHEKVNDNDKIKLYEESIDITSLETYYQKKIRILISVKTYCHL